MYVKNLCMLVLHTVPAHIKLNTQVQCRPIISTYCLNLTNRSSQSHNNITLPSWNIYYHTSGRLILLRLFSYRNTAWVNARPRRRTSLWRPLKSWVVFVMKLLSPADAGNASWNVLELQRTHTHMGCTTLMTVDENINQLLCNLKSHGNWVLPFHCSSLFFSFDKTLKFPHNKCTLSFVFETKFSFSKNLRFQPQH